MLTILITYYSLFLPQFIISFNLLWIMIFWWIVSSIIFAIKLFILYYYFFWFYYYSNYFLGGPGSGKSYVLDYIKNSNFFPQYNLDNFLYLNLDTFLVQLPEYQEGTWMLFFENTNNHVDLVITVEFEWLVILSPLYSFWFFYLSSYICWYKSIDIFIFALIFDFFFAICFTPRPLTFFLSRLLTI